jgi:DNA-binding MarR family transcriptional regulator
MIAKTLIALTRDGPGLSLIQLAVLLALHDRADPRARQVKVLADDLCQIKPNITRAMDVLESERLIRRSVLPGDKRTCVATLTAAGVAMAARIEAGWDGVTPARPPRSRDATTTARGA